MEDGQEWVMRRTMLLNTLGGDTELTDWIWNLYLPTTDLTPVAPSDGVSGEGCTRPGPGCEGVEWIQYIPSLMAVLFFIFFTTSSNLLLQNVSSEKENSTIEILMLSITPLQMLVGKILGLGMAAFTQMVVWLGALFAIMNVGGNTLNLPEGFSIPVSILFWAIVFFLLGYAIYASIMAGVGSMVPNLKESSQAAWVVMTPLLVSYVIGILAPLAESSHAALPTALSMFPLTAPILMVMRLTASEIPFWQPILSAGLMLITAYVLVRVVAAMFHTQHLLSGQSFSFKRFFSVFLGRA
jgi:ABC-2 type transport system permease protein